VDSRSSEPEPGGAAPPLAVASVAEERTSASWAPGPQPALTVAIPTFRHPAYLAELAAALERQTFPVERFEVIVVDDASGDETWPTIGRIASSTPLRMRGVRLASNSGPAAARNTAAASSRSDAIVFIDDDCLPTPEWLSAYAGAFSANADLIQGHTIAMPDSWTGPWERTVWVTGESWLFESCNIGYRRSSFIALSGFDAARPAVTEGSRPHFGEDAELGWRFRSAGFRTTFSSDALAYHRNLPGTYVGWLHEQRRHSLFPGLVKRAPGMGRALFLGTFLSRQTALFDLALASAATAAATSVPWFAAGALPWAWTRWRSARHFPGRPRPVRALQLAVGDVVGFVSLLQGSLRARRLVL
jgi:hypothetical protein